MRRLLLLLTLLVAAAIPLVAQGPVTQTFGSLSNNNQWTGTNSYAKGVTLGPYTVSQLSSISGIGAVIIVSDGTPGSNPCTGSGTGTLAIYVNGAWSCNLGNPIITINSTPCALGSSCTISGGSGGGNPTLDNCTPDETGNSFYSVTSLTSYFYPSWQFIFNTATYINCTVYIPTAQAGATIVLDIAVNDSTAGHTANFQTCDGVINSGTINTGSLTCASTQIFTTTSTAYNRVTLTFNVQSTLSNGSILVIKILTSTTGTAPTANMLIYPHFIL